jgi:hypothetical protein
MKREGKALFRDLAKKVNTGGAEEYDPVGDSIRDSLSFDVDEVM